MEKSRNLSLDILKIILAISVVFLHCLFLKDISEQAYFATVHGVFRIAVPTFLVISGFYFVNIHTLPQLKSWVKRIAALYAIWMIFYSPFWFELHNPLKMIFTIFNGYFVLWYLIGALFSGLLVYFLRNINVKIQIVISVLLFLTGCTIQMLGNLHIFHGIVDKMLNFNPTHRNFLFFCLPFFLTGYLLNKYKVSERVKVNGFILCISLLLVIVESLINYYFISKVEGLDQLFTLYLAAPITFLYFKSKNITGNTKELANFSTGIYLIHPLILITLTKYYSITETSLSFTVLFFSLISAYFLVLLNKKYSYIL